MGTLGTSDYWNKGVLDCTARENTLPSEVNMLEVPMPEILRLTTGGRFERIAELGCGLGTYSERLLGSVTTSTYHGFDIREDALTKFKSRLLGRVGNVASTCSDLLDFRNATEIEGEFDAVVSSGLVEHFYGSDLDKILYAHDKLTKKGGYVCIDVPNFSGINYLWYYLFDRPALDLHNIMTMREEVYMSFFRRRGYRIVFSGYCGAPRVWGGSSVAILRDGLDKEALGYGIAVLAYYLNKILDAAGRTMPEMSKQRDWATFYLFIAQKPETQGSVADEGGH